LPRGYCPVIQHCTILMLCSVNSQHFATFGNTAAFFLYEYVRHFGLVPCSGFRKYLPCPRYLFSGGKFVDKPETHRFHDEVNAFSYYLILPSALGPGVDSASNSNEYQEYS
jgi:hypothetical protein